MSARWPNQKLIKYYQKILNAQHRLEPRSPSPRLCRNPKRELSKRVRLEEIEQHNRIILQKIERITEREGEYNSQKIQREAFHRSRGTSQSKTFRVSQQTRELNNQQKAS